MKTCGLFAFVGKTETTTTVCFIINFICSGGANLLELSFDNGHSILLCWLFSCYIMYIITVYYLNKIIDSNYSIAILV